MQLSVTGGAAPGETHGLHPSADTDAHTGPQSPQFAKCGPTDSGAFPPLFAAWQADAWRGHIEKAASLFDPLDAWPTWVLSNHDRKRHRTRYGY